MDILTTIIGAVASLLGVVLGWGLNNLANRGKLHIYASTWSDDFTCQDEIGCYSPCVDMKKATRYSYSALIDVYNSSGYTKIMRNIEIVLSNDKKGEIKSVPLDDSKKKTILSMTMCDKAGSENIPPKTVLSLKFHGTIHIEDGEKDKIWKTRKIYLRYTDEKNNKKTHLLKEENMKVRFRENVREVTDNG